MDLYQKALARALDRPEADAGIAGEPMMAAVAHSQRVARLEAEIEHLRAALQYVLDDEPNLVPRATSSCRAYIRGVLEQSTRGTEK